MQLENFFKELFIHLCSSEISNKNKERRKFSEYIHHYKYEIFIKYLGKTSDQVHGNALPFFILE